MTLLEKLTLINGIEHWQKERWKRLRYWHNSTGLTLSGKHIFMKREVDLIREQKKRLFTLKQEVLQ